ncbi:MAG: S1 family peptidase [Patescibacteria group bacterium]
MDKIINRIKESIVFLGFIDNGREKIVGTGFLIKIEEIFHLVTAKHVVENKYDDLCVFLNSKQFNKAVIKPLRLIYKDNLNWIRHPNPNIDIAILPFLLGSDDKVTFISSELISKSLTDTHELSDVFYLSYQPGINNFKKDGNVNPIIRKGIISRVNNDDTFFIDGTAFPGNSGSPVFLFPTPIRIEDNKVMIGGPMRIQLLGVMGAYISYQDIAISQQTKKPKIIFEENTGISLIYSTKSLIEVTETDEFKKQIVLIKHKQSIPNGTIKPVSTDK